MKVFYLAPNDAKLLYLDWLSMWEVSNPGWAERYTFNESFLAELCGGKPLSEEADNFSVSFFFFPEWVLGGFPG